MIALRFYTFCVRFFSLLHFLQWINFAKRMRHLWTPFFVENFLCLGLYCSVSVINTIYTLPLWCIPDRLSVIASIFLCYIIYFAEAAKEVSWIALSINLRTLKIQCIKFEWHSSQIDSVWFIHPHCHCLIFGTLYTIAYIFLTIFLTFSSFRFSFRKKKRAVPIDDINSNNFRFWVVEMWINTLGKLYFWIYNFFIAKFIENIIHFYFNYINYIFNQVVRVGLN